MLNYYQPFLVPFLKPHSNKLPPSVCQYYYHSWEDGLWDLLKNKFPKKKHLVFLVPDFYCSDVLDNIKARGHKYIYYPLGADFQISSSRFKKYLATFSPDVVIIFHACGISSQLLSDTSWLPELSPSSLIIEDSVHRLVNPQEISFLNDRHFILDSLRKVSPLPGSRLFGTPAALSFPQSQARFSLYQLSSFAYYFLFRCALVAGFVLNNSSVVAFAHNTLLKRHDDIIGDSLTPYPGSKIFLPLIDRLNYAKVFMVKQKQIAIYEKMFEEFEFDKLIKNFKPVCRQARLKIKNCDIARLHIYPLVFSAPPNQKLEQYLNAHGFPVWFKFTDTPWSQDKSVLFLPLGFHVREKEVIKLLKAIAN